MTALMFILFVLVGLVATLELTSLLRRRQLLAASDNLFSFALDAMRVVPADLDTPWLERDRVAAQARCTDCKMKSACRLSLARTFAPGVPEGCPNTRTLADIACYRDTMRARDLTARSAELDPWVLMGNARVMRALRDGWVPV